LKVGEGARVSLTVNVDQADGLVNSASGIVTGFFPAIKENKNDYNPKYILVKFDDQRCGQNTRNKLKNIFGNTYSTPIKQTTVDIRKKTSHCSQNTISSDFGLGFYNSQSTRENTGSACCLQCWVLQNWPNVYSS